MYEIMSSDEAIRLIRDGDCICVKFVCGNRESGGTSRGPYRRYQRMRSPSHLTMISSAGFGLWDENRNAEGYIREGAVDRLICGHFGAMLSTKKLVMEDRFEAYNLPLGVFPMPSGHRQAGCLVLFPRWGLIFSWIPEGKAAGINRLSVDDSLDKYGGGRWEEFLYYKLPKITVALNKGDSGRPKGKYFF